MDPQQTLIKTIEVLSLPKFYRSFEESESHPEFTIWQKNLAKDFHLLLELLGTVKLSDGENVLALSSLLIFYYELKCAEPWVDVKDFYKKLNETFVLLYQIPLDDLLVHDNKFDTEKLYNACFSQLHRKLTSTEFKRYPMLIDVFCSLVEIEINVIYTIEINPVKVFPVSLLLTDDYVTYNKIKGLNCITQILKNLTTKHLEEGNYYEIIYDCLKKVSLERDIKLTKLCYIAILNLLKLLPTKVQVIKALDIYSNILEQLNIESHLHRKVQLFNCAKNLIQILGVNCVKKKSLKTIFCDNIDMCCSEGVAEILIFECLECLEEWTKHCWCVWRFKEDHKILSKLIKYLCVCQDKRTEERVIRLIIIFICVSTKEEQSSILTSLENVDYLKSHLVAIKNGVL